MRDFARTLLEIKRDLDPKVHSSITPLPVASNLLRVHPNKKYRSMYFKKKDEMVRHPQHCNGRHGDGDEEDKMDEDEDDLAPIPPEMIAEEIATSEAPKQELIDDEIPPAPQERIASASVVDANSTMTSQGPGQQKKSAKQKAEEYTRSTQDIIDSIMPLTGDVFDNDEAPASATHQGSLANRHYLSPVGNYLIRPRAERCDESSSALNSQCHFIITIDNDQESTSDKSAPLLEATLVEDPPEEPVYDAVRISTIQTDDSTTGCFRRFRSYFIPGLISLGLATVAIIATLVILDDEPDMPISVPNSTAVSEISI